MGGQFDKESSNKNFEWHRERLLREAKNPSAENQARVEFNLRAIANKHGEQAVQEVYKEYRSKKKK